jgi:hypothetical protein
MEGAAMDVVFDVLTLLGFRVHVSVTYWNYIVTVKHPVMNGRERDVRHTIESPDEIRQSRRDPTVYLFYHTQSLGRWVCAVVKRLDGDGFLVTAYPTDAIKEGIRIWPR